MHIVDGTLSPAVLTAGSALAVGGIGVGLAKMNQDDVLKTAVLSSAFFVISLIHLPTPAGSTHLLLSGLMGIVLGWAVFPAVFVGLLLQSLLFGFGGLTTLGVNTLNFALPGLCCYYLLSRPIRAHGARAAFFYGAAGGAGGVIGTGLSYGVWMALSIKNIHYAVAGLWMCHLPVIVIEALITGWCIAFLRKVRPESLAPCNGRDTAKEPSHA